MKKYIAVIVMAAVMLPAGYSFAGDAGASVSAPAFQVQTTIPASCSAATAVSPVNIPYDGSSNADGSFAITSTCRNATPFVGYISGTRQLVGPGGVDTINIEFYSDSSGGTVYPSTAATGISYTAGTSTPENRTVYYRIASGQLSGAGWDKEYGTYTGDPSLFINFEY